MKLQQAMINLDSDLPKSVQVAGEATSRFVIGVCAVLITEQLLHIIIKLL
jgi:hypothetical protein